MHLVIQHVPVINTIFNIAMILENLGEQLSEEVMIRRLFEPKFPDIIQTNGELLCARTVSPGPAL